MKIRPMRSRVVPCGRTDTTRLIAAFRNFAKAPKKTYVAQDSYLLTMHKPTHGHGKPGYVN